MKMLNFRKSCFTFAFAALCTGNALVYSQGAPVPVPVPAPASAPDQANLVSDEIIGGVYVLPGVTALKDNVWVGSDNLYNLTNAIGIAVEIIKPQGNPIPINPHAIRDRVASIFQEAGIIPQADRMSDQPPLPFLHILVMIYPLEKGYVAYVSGRLFEAIKLVRMTPDKGITWQGITWEKEDLIVSSSEQLSSQLAKSIDNIAKSFTERFKFFESLKAQKVKH